MKKHNLLFTFLLLAASTPVLSQSSAVIKNYIERFKDIAMEEMQRTGVPAAITLAQGIHETGAGTSDLVIRSNNHFGIKCKTEWKGEAVYHDDDERGECFRKYNDPIESYRDHSDFLKNRPYYQALFKLDPTDYEGWAYGLKKAGYATNPKYPQILIKLIRDYNLQEYTLIALGEKKSEEPIWVSNEAKSENPAAQPAINIETEPENTDYPSGSFEINRTRVVFVSKGISYLKIAEEYGVSLARLFEFNEMEEADVAAASGLIFLQRKRKSGANEFRTVKSGENLHRIAQEEGIRLENLQEYNHLNKGQEPAVGETLYLQYKAPKAPLLVGAATEVAPRKIIAASTSNASEMTAAAVVYHRVQPKETAYGIAKKYEVTVEELLQWNELKAADLKVGQQLKIYKKANDAR